MRYAGRRLAAGDVFETKCDTDAKILTAIGHAEAVEPKAKTGRKPKTLDYSGGGRVSVDPNELVKSEKVQDQVDAVREIEQQSASRTYQRRDMEAERE